MERFGNEETGLIWEGQVTKATRTSLDQNLHRKAQQQIEFVLNVTNPAQCLVFKEFKRLHPPLRGVYQFRIGGPYRLRFRWENGQAVQITVGDWHDEEK